MYAVINEFMFITEHSQHSSSISKLKYIIEVSPGAYEYTDVTQISQKISSTILVDAHIQCKGIKGQLLRPNL